MGRLDHVALVRRLGSGPAIVHTMAAPKFVPDD